MVSHETLRRESVPDGSRTGADARLRRHPRGRRRGAGCRWSRAQCHHGLPVTEVDLATTLSPDAVTRACEAAGLVVHPTGIDHGTVTVISDHTPFEVTTLRHDVETDGRRAG